MISARKTNHSTGDRLDRRQPIVANTMIVLIHVIVAALHGQELRIAVSKLRHQPSCMASSFEPFKESSPPLHTFPIAHLSDSAVSCIELC
jgi:hypothetical protein